MGSKRRQCSLRQVKATRRGSKAAIEQSTGDVSEAAGVGKAGRGRSETLQQIFEHQIVPGLLRLCSENPTEGTSSRSASQPPRCEDFAKLLLRYEADVIEAYLRGIVQQGVAVGSLLLHLFAPTARKLGELWEGGAIGFADVALATTRLQQLLQRDFLQLERRRDEKVRRILLSPAPSESHTFGLGMAAQFFRQEGWQVIGPSNGAELLGRVSQEFFTVVGLSLSCNHLIEKLRSAIQEVRLVSLNRDVKIIVGGRLAAHCPHMVSELGADFVAATLDAGLKRAASVR
jgi:methanogenic corrinoid protein MtbC1